MADRIAIDIPADKSRAIVMLRPAEGETVSFEEVMDALLNAGVVHGFLKERINKAVEEKNYFRRFTAAVHNPPVSGAKATVEFLISEDMALKETTDGRIDYYDLHQYKSVSKGQPVAKKNPPGKGRPGKSITGEVIPASAGEDLNLLEYIGGTGIVADPQDKNILIAIHSGIYSRVGNKIDIKDTLTINQDVDFKIGSIRAPAKLVINGDVRSGFELISERDISISGVVENATVITSANVEVMKGIVRGGAPIEVGGKLTVNYIVERTHLKAGELEVKNTLIGSMIQVEKSVKARKIVGGTVLVGRKLEVVELGNEKGNPTRIEIGVDATLLSKVRVLSGEIKQLKRERQRIREVMVEEQFTYEDSEAKLEALLFSTTSGSKQLVKRLEAAISETSVKIKEFSDKIKEIDRDLKAKLEELEKITPDLAIENPQIIVKGVVHPNVTVKMGMGSEIRTKKEGRNLRFELDDEGKVQILPNN